MTKAQAKAVFYWGTALSTIILLVLTYNSLGQLPKRTNQQMLTAEVAQGKWVWQKHNCNDCHTILGIGGYYAPDLTKEMAHRDPGWVKNFLKDPEKIFPSGRQMPNLHLTDGEITGLVAFLGWVNGIDTNNWPPKPFAASVPVQGENPGEAVFRAQGCSSCHLLDGIGGHAGPDLTHVGARRSSQWIEEQLKNPKSHNPDSIMPGFAKLPEKDIEDLTSYLAGLK